MHNIVYIINISVCYQEEKQLNKAITAVARELAGFIWAIALEIRNEKRTNVYSLLNS